MNFQKWSKLSTEERQAHVNSIYDIMYVENLISYMQYIIGMWNIAQQTATEDQLAELDTLLNIVDAEQALELFAARYNQLLEACN